MIKITREEVKSRSISKTRIKWKQIINHAEQLEKILDYIKELEKINTDDVPTTRAIEATNVLRKDEKKYYKNPDELLDLAPSREDKFFKVPKILNE